MTVINPHIISLEESLKQVDRLISLKEKQVEQLKKQRTILEKRLQEAKQENG